MTQDKPTNSLPTSLKKNEVIFKDSSNTINSEVQSAFKFEIPTGVSTSKVFSNETGRELGKGILILGWFFSISFGLAAVFTWFWLNLHVLATIMAVVAVCGVISVFWSSLSLWITEKLFLRKLKKALKTADLKMFLPPNAPQKVSKRLTKRALLSLIPVFSCRGVQTVNFIKGKDTTTVLSYIVHGEAHNSEVVLVFVPAEPSGEKEKSAHVLIGTGSEGAIEIGAKGIELGLQILVNILN